MEKVQQQEQKNLRTRRDRLLFTVPSLGSVKKVNSFINIKRWIIWVRICSSRWTGSLRQTAPVLLIEP